MENASQGLRSLAREENFHSDFLGRPNVSAGQTHVVLRKSPGHFFSNYVDDCEQERSGRDAPLSGSAVTLLKCSKACAISFSIGVVVGFMLRKRFRRWVAKMLKRFKDD